MLREAHFLRAPGSVLSEGLRLKRCQTSMAGGRWLPCTWRPCRIRGVCPLPGILQHALSVWPLSMLHACLILSHMGSFWVWVTGLNDEHQTRGFACAKPALCYLLPGHLEAISVGTLAVIHYALVLREVQPSTALVLRARGPWLSVGVPASTPVQSCLAGRHPVPFSPFRFLPSWTLRAVTLIGGTWPRSSFHFLSTLQFWRERGADKSLFKEPLVENFPRGPVAKTPCSQCRGSGFNPWWGN